jgi:hypothetical protein
MFNIITAVIGISLFSLFLSAGISYYNPNSFDRMVMKIDVSSSLAKIDAAINRFHIYNEALPEKISDIYPSLMKSDSVSKNLSVVSILNNNGIMYSCIAGNLRDYELEAVVMVRKELPNGSIVIGKDCYEKADAEFTFDGKEYEPVSITYKHH